MQILDQLVAITEYHRRHAIRCLGAGGRLGPPEARRVSRRIYDDAVREALILIWGAPDRVCGRRLKMVIPGFVESIERHGHLSL